MTPDRYRRNKKTEKMMIGGVQRDVFPSAVTPQAQCVDKPIKPGFLDKISTPNEKL